MAEGFKNLKMLGELSKDLLLDSNIKTECIEFLLQVAKSYNSFEEFRELLNTCSKNNSIIKNAFYVFNRMCYSDIEKLNPLLYSIYYLGKNASIRDVLVHVHDSSNNNAHNGYKEVKCNLIQGQDPIKYLSITESLEIREHILKLHYSLMGLYECWFESKSSIPGVFLNRNYDYWEGDDRYLETGRYKASTLFFDYYCGIYIGDQGDIFSPIKLKLNGEGLLYRDNNEKDTIKLSEIAKYKNIKVEIELEESLMRNKNITFKNPDIN